MGHPVPMADNPLRGRMPTFGRSGIDNVVRLGVIPTEAVEPATRRRLVFRAARAVRWLEDRGLHVHGAPLDLRAARGADKALVSDAGVFDVYEGEALGADKKSVAIWLTLQPVERTLTDEEIDAAAAKVVANVEKQTGGTLRG